MEIAQMGSGRFERLRRIWTALLTSDFGQKVSETFATRIALIGINGVAGLLVTRVLGPDGRGRYAVAIAVSTLIIQFGNLGLQTSNTFAIAQDRNLLSPLLGNALAVSFIFGSGIATITGLVLAARPGFENIGGILLLLALITVPLGLGQMLLENLLIGLQDIRTYNRVELTTSVVGFGLIALLLAMRTVTVEAVVLAGLIATLIGFLIALCRLRRLLQGKLSVSLSLFKTNLIYGTKVYLAALFAFSLLRIDVLMVQHLMGITATGYYSAAASLADLLYLLPSVIGTVLFPKLCGMSKGERWRLARSITHIVMVIMIVGSILTMLLARPVIHFVLGQSFLPSALPLIILSVGMIFYGANIIVATYLASIGFPWFSVGAWFAAMLLNIIINFLLIPERGTAGAAIASLISYAIVFTAQYIYASSVRRDGAAANIQTG